MSFILKCSGGCVTDRFITEDCHILDKLLYGDNLMSDKGFNISDLLISKGWQLIIPPFLKEKQRFSKKNSKKTFDIAKARIHVERAIARIKDFRILSGAFPVTMRTCLTFFLICAAITNLTPPLVPLWIKMKQDLVSIMHSFLFNCRKPKRNQKKWYWTFWNVVGVGCMYNILS